MKIIIIRDKKDIEFNDLVSKPKVKNGVLTFKYFNKLKNEKTKAIFTHFNGYKFYDLNKNELYAYSKIKGDI